MMINLFIYFFMIMFMMGIWVFSSSRKYLLITLLTLEYLVLVLFCLLFLYLNFMNYEGMFSMMFLTFSVCEGALGLSILVSLVRTHGGDYFQSFSVLGC